MYSDSDVDSDVEDRSTFDSVPLSGTPTSSRGFCVAELPSPASLQSAVARQGPAHVKLTVVDGKRAGDRSWKGVWAVAQGHAILLYKDKLQSVQTPMGAEGQISLRGSRVEVASDYTKRRNVLRITTQAGSELLFRTETQSDMSGWLSSLQQEPGSQEGDTGSRVSLENLSQSNNNLENIASSPTSVSSNNNVSPPMAAKGSKKLSSLRTRSPPGQSPISKTSKPFASETGTSPKPKTWKRRLGSQLKKIQGNSSSLSQATPLPEGASIGIALDVCPQSEENEFVPLLVGLCVDIVETRGLRVQGIYRIPGNKAAVTHLTEIVNRGPKSINLSDPRWSDVNVISSLLKQFFQKLPDPLISNKLYPYFIEASKVEEPTQRLFELKRLIQELPDHHYETLRFLLVHLSHVVEHCEYNKMDVRNLAIVFGPTLVRSIDDNMATMVNDMSHQCRIVETLISHVHWFFSDEEIDDAPPTPMLENVSLGNSISSEMLTPSEIDMGPPQSLLLDNIQKIEGCGKGDSRKDLVLSIISAANRKVQKVKTRKNLEEASRANSEVRSEDHSLSFEERDMEKENELKQTQNITQLPDSVPMSQRKVSNISYKSLSGDETSTSDVSIRSENNPCNQSTKELGSGHWGPSSSVDGSLEMHSLPATREKNISTSSHIPSNSSSLMGDEVAIRSYTGLSANTQERIRRFEMETRAMLQRDFNKYKRDSLKREEEQQKLEEQWTKAKQDLEQEDIFDQLADNPSEIVSKLAEYSWHLQRLSGSERTSMPKQSSSGVSGATVISASLAKHIPSFSSSSSCVSTNAAVVSQVANGVMLPALIHSQLGSAYLNESVKDNSTEDACAFSALLNWLDNDSSHGTLGSNCSSTSSGYGSLTRSSVPSSNITVLSGNQLSDNENIKVSATLSANNTKSKPHTSDCFSTSASPALLSPNAQELTATRKIGKTTIYPDSPTLSFKKELRLKESLFHHIIPVKLYHSPRPVRRGSSSENINRHSPFESQKVACMQSHLEKVKKGSELGRCGSLDSIHSMPQDISDEVGSDLLSAITATFEKMRSLQDSPVDCARNENDPWREGEQGDQFGLYRDPSLHRRKGLKSSSLKAAEPVDSPDNREIEIHDSTLTMPPPPPPPLEAGVKRSDSLSKSEKTESNLKEKKEKRARELKRSENLESLTEKKPKELKRFDASESAARQKKLGESCSLRRSSEIRTRRHNVKELKEKFEQNSAKTSKANGSLGLKASGSAKSSKSCSRRHKGGIRRRHTVGGTKDLARLQALNAACGGDASRQNGSSSAWDQLHPGVDREAPHCRSLDAWIARERLRTSSPDLSRPLLAVEDKENLQIHLSSMKPLYPLLESHV